jgi:hypothetical protein
MPGGPTVQVSPTGVAVTGQAQHARATVTGAAALLSAYITGGFPKNPATPIAGQPTQGPSIAYLQAEAANTGSVYVTWDGSSTPLANAQLGFLVPTAPAYLRIPGRDCVAAIKCIASTGSQYLQVFLEM